MDQWLTLGQAARFLGIAQSTIRKWSDEGKIPTFNTPGGHRRYRLHDLEDFIGRPRVPGPAPALSTSERVAEIRHCFSRLAARLVTIGNLPTELRIIDEGIALVDGFDVDASADDPPAS